MGSSPIKRDTLLGLNEMNRAHAGKNIVSVFWDLVEMCGLEKSTLQFFLFRPNCVPL
jgi:hypothetical protein